MTAKIIGLGHAIPDTVMHNDDFVKKGLDTTHEWIVERTGIETRYIADDTTSTSDLATEAAKKCIQNANIDKSIIDLIIVATSTPDYLAFPSTACLVQEKLDLDPIGAFDISAACTGFSYALSMASSFINSNMYKHILVIGADCLSKITNFEDRGTCILFADGAGAALVTESQNDNEGILKSYMYADGKESTSLLIPKGGAKNPISTDIINNKEHFIHMDGKAVFKLAINRIVPAIKNCLKENQLSPDDITYLICHQANKRILDKIAEFTQIPPEKCIINVNKYGNTSAATIPLALSELNEKTPLKQGDIIVLAGFGAGFTWGVNLIRWST